MQYLHFRNSTAAVPLARSFSSVRPARIGGSSVVPVGDSAGYIANNPESLALEHINSGKPTTSSGLAPPRSRSALRSRGDQ